MNAWSVVERLLVSAYAAGRNGEPFDMLRAREQVYEALNSGPRDMAAEAAETDMRG